jgi:signal transduction histidine kinase
MLRQLMHSFYRLMKRSYLHAEHQIEAVGIVGLLIFPLYFLVWRYIFPQPYDNFWLRLVAGLLCLGLVLRGFWPKRYQKFLPYYWFLAIFYCLPFFFSFLFLKNDATNISAMSLLVAIFLMILLVDWISLTVLTLCGWCLAWVIYFYTTPDVQFSYVHWEYIFIYIMATVFGSVFNYKSALLQSQKMAGMAEISGIIAHELRTPLLGIKSGAIGLKRYVPSLFEGYAMADEAGLPVTKIRSAHYQALEPVLDRIEMETRYANTMIDMLLMKVGRISKQDDHGEAYSIIEAIDSTLTRYPFQSQTERDLISIRLGNDFHFHGNKVLFVHLLFNLIKNALYFIAEAKKGEIYIWLMEGDKYNELHFKDTAQGVPAHLLPKLFNKFFTTTRVGTGVGLSFCKMVMESMDGEIACFSREGEFTEFVLYFNKEAL